MLEIGHFSHQHEIRVAASDLVAVGQDGIRLALSRDELAQRA
jgi:hypothetical protein